MSTRKISNTYEAAYYLTQGAVLRDFIKSKKVQESIIHRRHQAYSWIFLLSGVTDEMRLAWADHSAVANVRDLQAQRLKLKKKAHDSQRRGDY